MSTITCFTLTIIPVSINPMKTKVSKTILFIIAVSLTALVVPFVLYSAKPVKEAFNDASFVISSNGEEVLEKTEGETLAVWIATVYNLNFHTKIGMNKEEVRIEAKEIIENVSSAGMNTVFLQVRPMADSFYESDVFPWSELITGVQGKAPDYDPLQIFIEEAKKKNISVHAWINPYRITKGSLLSPNTDVNTLSKNHPARIHPEWVVEYGGALYFNPSIKEVRQLIIDGATEIVKKYDVDGIHMDDYFYPYPVYDGDKKLIFDDSIQFQSYNGELTLEEWRRFNVNELIQGLYTSIKIVNQDLKLGISPFGVWQNSDGINGGSMTTAGIQGFKDLYADAVAWINGGYIDYIAPQIYWSFEEENTSFETVSNWWNNITNGKNIEFIPGLAVYKLNNTEIIGWNKITQLQMQLRYIREKLNASGAAFYGYNELISESDGVKLLIEEIKNKNN